MYICSFVYPKFDHKRMAHANRFTQIFCYMGKSVHAIVASYVYYICMQVSYKYAQTYMVRSYILSQICIVREFATVSTHAQFEIIPS